jgi:hypothetical protein
MAAGGSKGNSLLVCEGVEWLVLGHSRGKDDEDGTQEDAGGEERLVDWR